MVPDQRELWDRWHEQHAHASHREHADHARDQFLQALPSHGPRNVLELGCGQGRDAMHLALAGYTVYALDRSPVAVWSATRSAINANVAMRLVAHDHSRRLPFRAELFDGVYAHLALHYFDDDTTLQIVDEISRVLKPDGVLYFTVRSTADTLYGKGRPLADNTFCFAGHVRRFFDDVSLKTLLHDWHIERIREYIDPAPTTNPGYFIEVLARRADVSKTPSMCVELVKIHDPMPTWNEAPDYFDWNAFDWASQFPSLDLGADALQQQALLAETDNFYVIPDQFGVVSGHLLVLPKQAASSMASLHSAYDEEFTWLLRHISDVVARTYDARIVVSEHGECGCKTADQAHVHILPIPKTVSDEDLVDAVDRALRRRMVGIERVIYRGTVFTFPEDMRELLEHPEATVKGKLVQYADLRQGDSYPPSARSGAGQVSPYVYFQAGGIEFTSTSSFRSQFVREIAADVVGLPDGVWNRRVHVDRSNMFDTFRRLVKPIATLGHSRCYGFRPRVDRQQSVAPCSPSSVSLVDVA